MRVLRPSSAVLAGLLLIAGAAWAAPGEIAGDPAEGWHAIEHDAYVDLGTFVDCVTWHYTVREGDTLGEVAQRELGSARRHKEILALNPGADPRRLHAGTSLEMPPRSNGCERGSPRYVFFAWTPAAGAWSAPRRLADEKIHQLSHGTRLFAVPVGRLAQVCAASGSHPLCARALAKDPKVARSGALQLQASLPDADAARRLVTHWKVVAIANGQVRLKQTAHARYDAEGRRLEATRAGGSGGTTALRALVFLLMLSGVGFAVAHTQRRRSDEDTEDYEDDEDEDEDEEEDDDS